MSMSQDPIPPELGPRRDLFEYVQAVPKQFGKVVRLERRGKRVIAVTETGDVVIVRM